MDKQPPRVAVEVDVVPDGAVRSPRPVTLRFRDREAIRVLVGDLLSVIGSLPADGLDDAGKPLAAPAAPRAGAWVKGMPLLAPGAPDAGEACGCSHERARHWGGWRECVAAASAHAGARFTVGPDPRADSGELPVAVLLSAESLSAVTPDDGEFARQVALRRSLTEQARASRAARAGAAS